MCYIYRGIEDFETGTLHCTDYYFPIEVSLDQSALHFEHEELSIWAQLTSAQCSKLEHTEIYVHKFGEMNHDEIREGGVVYIYV